MSDLWNVLGYYEMGEEAQAKGDYFNAVKYFRLCYFYFEYGELPIYIEEVSIKGGEAYERYKKLSTKLTAEELIEIKKKTNELALKQGISIWMSKILIILFTIGVKVVLMKYEPCKYTAQHEIIFAT